MTEPLVLTADHGAVRVLTLNRPAARNALSRDLIRATYTALTEADADESVRAVVLTGADPAFCAGVDLKEAQRDGLKYFEEFRSQSCIAAVAKMRTPIIGAINGATFTGGLEMALGCDFLVASERAVFADTHARVGILPGGGMTARLPQVVGLAMARRLSMTGEVVDAARAERIGLVTEVVAHERLLDRALELAGQIAEVPGPTMLGLKEIYTTGAAAVVDPALAAEEKIAFAQHRDFEGLGDQFRAVSERNKRQIESYAKRERVERVARPDLLRRLLRISDRPGFDVEHPGELLHWLVGGPARIAVGGERPPGCAHFARHGLGRGRGAIERRADRANPACRTPAGSRSCVPPRSARRRNRIRRDTWCRRRRRVPARCAASASGGRNRSTPVRIAHRGRLAGAPPDRPARHRASAATSSAPVPPRPARR